MSSVAESSPEPSSSAPIRRDCTLCKKAIPDNHRYKRCDDCRDKITAQTARRKARQELAKKQATAEFLKQADPVITTNKRKSEDISVVTANTPNLSAISKKPRIVPKKSGPPPPHYEIRCLKEFYVALTDARKVHINVYHSIIADDKIDHFSRAKLVAAEIQHACGFKLGKGRVKRDQTTSGDDCCLTFHPEPAASRYNGPVRISVEGDNSHPLAGVKGQKITVEIRY